MTNEKEYYIHFYAHGYTHTVGPMSQSKANRWFNNIERMGVDMDDGEYIQMYFMYLDEPSADEYIDAITHGEPAPSSQWIGKVDRVYAKPNGKEKADSYSLYDAKVLWEKQHKALLEVAETEGLYSKRLERLAKRAIFSRWLYEVGTKEVANF